MVEHRTLTTPPAAAARTRGVIFVHSVPRALVSHVEWALAGALGASVALTWLPQPAAPGHLRAEASWAGRPGTAARIATVLRTWNQLRAEVTEEPSAGHEGERFCITPTLGLFRATIGPHGDIMVSEDRLRGAVARGHQRGSSVEHELAMLLGEPWDVELEPYRHAGDGVSARWLHEVG